MLSISPELHLLAPILPRRLLGSLFNPATRRSPHHRPSRPASRSARADAPASPGLALCVSRRRSTPGGSWPGDALRPPRLWTGEVFSIMTFRSWLPPGGLTRHGRRKAPAARHTQLTLELLEDRLTPSGDGLPAIS